MYEPKTEKDIRCPLEYGMKLFGGKWKSRIICILENKGVVRYNELKKELINVTDTVLSATLKEMAADQMIIRTQYNEIPPRVEYSLSDVGKSILPILYSICAWSGAYQEKSDTNLQCSRCNYKGKYANP